MISLDIYKQIIAESGSFHTHSVTCCKLLLLVPTMKAGGLRGIRTSLYRWNWQVFVRYYVPSLYTKPKCHSVWLTIQATSVFTNSYCVTDAFSSGNKLLPSPELLMILSLLCCSSLTLSRSRFLHDTTGWTHKLYNVPIGSRERCLGRWVLWIRFVWFIQASIQPTVHLTAPPYQPNHNTLYNQLDGLCNLASQMAYGCEL